MAIYSSPINYPLWFVRDLMIIAIITPLINQLFRHFGAMLPIVAGILWFSLTNVVYGHAYLLITALFYFSLGGYLSFHQRDMVKDFKKLKITGAVVYIVAAVSLLVYAYGSGLKPQIIEQGYIGTNMIYVKNIAIFSGLLVAYNLAVLLIEKCHIRTSVILSSSAFFIYAAHALVLDYVKKFMTLLIPPVNDFSAVSLYVLTDIVVCGGLLLVFIFMKRYTPRVLAPFVGGRI